MKPDAATAEPASVTAKPEQIINNIAKPKQSTKCVFTPATAEMNSGFLTFQDDEIGSTSKFHSCVTSSVLPPPYHDNV